MHVEGCSESLLEEHVLLDPGGIGSGTLVGSIPRPRGCLGTGGGDALLQAGFPEVVIIVIASLVLLSSFLLQEDGLPNQALAEGADLEDGLALHRFQSPEAVSGRIFLRLVEDEGLCWSYCCGCGEMLPPSHEQDAFTCIEHGLLMISLGRVQVGEFLRR